MSFNPLRSVLMWYVNHSRRFDKQLWEPYEDENGPGYRCPICGHVANEPWKICEDCFYPLPLVGNHTKLNR